jgi:hypothetical protein
VFDDFSGSGSGTSSFGNGDGAGICGEGGVLNGSDYGVATRDSGFLTISSTPGGTNTAGSSATCRWDAPPQFNPFVNYSGLVVSVGRPCTVGADCNEAGDICVNGDCVNPTNRGGILVDVFSGTNDSLASRGPWARFRPIDTVSWAWDFSSDGQQWTPMAEGAWTTGSNDAVGLRLGVTTPGGGAPGFARFNAVYVCP